MYKAGDQSRDPATGRRRYYHPEQKDYATFLETNEETGGERTLVEVAPGGTPPHYHKTYEEHFEVLRGELEVHVGGETRRREGDRSTLHAAQLPQPHRRTDHVPGRAATWQRGVREGAQGRLRPGERRSEPLYHPYYLAVLLGWSDMRLPGVFTVAEPAAAAGEAGAAQGD
jgi:mannose-6-phosphate isomerase-like protein (cupin superfamily)